MGRIRQRLSNLPILVLAAILVSLAVMLSTSNEPVFERKRLSAWLREYEIQAMTNGETLSRTSRVAMAIRQIGTNGLPILLTMLNSEDSAMRAKLAGLLKSQRLIPFDVMTADRSRSMALWGLFVLGDSAKPFVRPVLELTKHRNPEIRRVAVCALAFMDPPVLEVLPFLIDALQDSSWEVRASAANALRNIDMHKRSAGFVLNRVVPESELLAAVPALNTALRDPRPMVRQSVASALKQIDPQSADAAGLK